MQRKINPFFIKRFKKIYIPLTTEGYNPSNREGNHEGSSYRIRRHKRGLRNEQGKDEVEAQGRSYAPGLENS